MHTTLTPDEIWGENVALGRQPDLFNRRQEAEQLIAYIESAVGRTSIRDDKRAYTVAVEAPYGEGKSFFLRRLADHLSINHPVAFVDAWADDLADEPLTALVATLKSALDPHLKKPELQKQMSDFMRKTGRVGKIVGWGLLRRGASLAITGKAVDAAEEVLSGLSEDVKQAATDGLQEIGSGTVDDATTAVRSVNSHALMERRVADFEERKAAVQEMKDSLRAIVDSLSGNVSRPIVIVIDELDRCRPTYAIKLLEEIKHLFDVPGLVFILGLHGEQLGHSISGAYGAGFDGRAYLRRFIDREYRLAQPELSPLLERLCASANIPANAFRWPPMVISQIRDLDPSLPQLLAEYMKVYGLGARDAFQLVDIFQTSMAVANRQTIHLPYFLPLAIGQLKGLPFGQLPEPASITNWVYMPNWSRTNSDATEYSFSGLADAIQEATQMPYDDLLATIDLGKASYATRLVSNQRLSAEEQPIWTVFGYSRLLRVVARFTDPQHVQQTA